MMVAYFPLLTTQSLKSTYKPLSSTTVSNFNNMKFTKILQNIWSYNSRTSTKISLLSKNLLLRSINESRTLIIEYLRITELTLI